MNHRALAAVVLAAWWNCPCLNAGTAETTSAQIRAEATRSNRDIAGRPLPLVSHWTTGSHKLSAGWAPERQIELLEQGHFLLPWFAHPSTTAALSDEARKSFVSYFMAIVESADRVHRNALLRDWWRKGELVPNRAHKHFYQGPEHT